MGWDSTRFDAFVNDVVKMSTGDLPGYGYPHVIFPYAASDEMHCIERLREMPALLHTRGLAATLIPVAQVVADVLRRDAARPLGDSTACARLESDIATARDGIATRVARRIQKQLPVSAQVLVLGRLGALYPFGTVSGLLDALYRVGVHIPVAAAYPGSANGVTLHFLGLTESHGGYRGHIVS